MLAELERREIGGQGHWQYQTMKSASARTYYDDMWKLVMELVSAMTMEEMLKAISLKRQILECLLSKIASV